MKSLKNLRLTDKKEESSIWTIFECPENTVKAKYKENTLMNNLFYSILFL